MPEVAFRTDKTPDSPEIPFQPGLALVAGKPFKDDDGVTRVPLHGAYQLPGREQIHNIAVIALLDGSPQVASAAMTFDGPPVKDAQPPPGVAVSPNQLEGGYFNCELRTDFRIPPSGGTFHVSAHYGTIRTDIVTVDVPPLP